MVMDLCGLNRPREILRENERLFCIIIWAQAISLTFASGGMKLD